ncbi:MAG: hypothetical protein AAGC44_15100 [Planctomycetota bacterium]
MLASCTGTRGGRVVLVDDFAALYADRTFAPNVVGAVPLPRDRVGRPPLVVNWFYAGTGQGVHRLVLRTLTWDEGGDPVMSQTRYDVPVEQLVVAEPFVVTRRVARWVPLHEAAQGVAPPIGLDTWRQRIEPRGLQPPDGAEEPGGITPGVLPPGILPPDLPVE